MKPIIGIVSRVCLDNDLTSINYVNEEYRIAIIKNGGIPILLLPFKKIKYYNYDDFIITKEEKKYIEALVNMCDGILLPGGYRWYKWEEYLFKYAYKINKPVLGICCGMQEMISSLEEKNTIFKLNNKEHYKKYNYINILENTLLKEIIKKNKMKVICRHKEYVKESNVLKISSYSDIIESVENKNKSFCLGVQFHPESLLNEDNNKIYKYFIDKCKEDKFNI